MSSGQYCLIRDLGLVKGGKGMRHHEVVLALSWRGVFRFLLDLVRDLRRGAEGDATVTAGELRGPAPSTADHMQRH